MFERCHTKNGKKSLKPHIQYFNFWSKIHLDHSVHQVGGGTALDAVVKAVKVLEDDKWGNAGRGSVLNAEGRVEMDASVVEGR